MTSPTSPHDLLVYLHGRAEPMTLAYRTRARAMDAHNNLLAIERGELLDDDGARLSVPFSQMQALLVRPNPKRAVQTVASPSDNAAPGGCITLQHMGTTT